MTFKEWADAFKNHLAIITVNLALFGYSNELARELGAWAWMLWPAKLSAVTFGLCAVMQGLAITLLTKALLNGRGPWLWVVFLAAYLALAALPIAIFLSLLRKVLAP